MQIFLKLNGSLDKFEILQFVQTGCTHKSKLTPKLIKGCHMEKYCMFFLIVFYITLCQMLVGTCYFERKYTEPQNGIRPSFWDSVRQRSKNRSSSLVYLVSLLKIGSQLVASVTQRTFQKVGQEKRILHGKSKGRNRFFKIFFLPNFGDFWISGTLKNHYEELRRRRWILED